MADDLQYLTEAERALLASGQLSPFAANLRNTLRAPEQNPVNEGVRSLASGLGGLLQNSPLNYDRLQELASEPSTPAYLAGMANFYATPGQLFENFVADPVAGAWEGTEDLRERAKIITTGGTVGDLAKVGQDEQLAVDQANEAAAAENAATQSKSQAAQANIINGLFGGNADENTMASFDLGPAAVFGAPQLPLPPESVSPDYIDVRNRIEQMRPEAVNEQEFENQKGMAVLAGMAMGLIGADPESAGNMLLNLGLGGLAGVANVDAAKAEAKDKFKEGMRDYLEMSLKIDLQEAENKSRYAEKVWETQLKQTMLNYDAGQASAKARETRLIQSGDEIWAEKTVDGKRVLEKVKGSKTERFNNITNTLMALGVGDEKTALSVAQQAMFGGDAVALPTIAVALMNRRGQTEDFLSNLEQMGPEGKEFYKRYSSVGTRSAGMPVHDKGAIEDQAMAAREAMLIQLLASSPDLLSQAMKKSGMPPMITQSFDAQMFGGQ